MTSDLDYLPDEYREWATQVWARWHPENRTLRRLLRYANRLYGTESEESEAIRSGIRYRSQMRIRTRAQERHHIAYRPSAN